MDGHSAMLLRWNEPIPSHPRFLSLSLSLSVSLSLSLFLAGMGALASIAYIPKRDWIEESQRADQRKRESPLKLVNNE